MIVKGRVQGVFYRESAKKKALELGLSGTIQNLSDGSVEINTTGNNDQLEKFEKWCKKGPPAASVQELILTDCDYLEFDSFKVIRD